MNERKITCENCGEEFSCAAQTGECWCFKIEIPPPVSAKISREFSDCLCRKCLLETAKNDISAVTDFTSAKT